MNLKEYIDKNDGKPLQILELFGGIGAPRVALRNLGIPVKSIDYVEIDEKAVRSYNAMFRNDLEYKTQTVVDWNLRPDILVHGSPCQDFSIIGNQKGADEGSGTHSSLMWETVHIIENMGVWKPKIVIWENVKNVLSKTMRHSFDKYLNEMKRLGYTNTFETLDARDFGLPQQRKRVFTVSVLGGGFDFQTIKKTPMKPLGAFLENSYDSWHVIKSPSMLSKIGKQREGNNRTLTVLDPCGNCNTITTRQDRCPNAGVIQLQDGGYRLLTEKECWRLMGFDDSDFEAAQEANPSKPGCKNGALYKQAGNSMPVPVLEAIFENIEI